MDDLEIGRIASGTLVRADRASENHNLTLPTPLQVEEMLERFQGDKAFRERYERIGNIACLEWLKGRSTPSTENCRCIENPYIKANGTMCPCTMLPVEKFAIPDVYNHPVEEIFYKALSLWAELPELNRRRVKSLKQCTNCSGIAHCAGGCMGRAYAASGDPMTVEDRCALRKVVYRWKALNDEL